MDLLDVLAVCIFFIGRSAPVMGDDFRMEFSKLGDLCGFSPTNVKFMAVSATMSKKRGETSFVY